VEGGREVTLRGVHSSSTRVRLSPKISAPRLLPPALRSPARTQRPPPHAVLTIVSESLKVASLVPLTGTVLREWEGDGQRG